jgi:menaquinol-cytochrome c reductase iron-sulfur subunit
VGLPVIGYIISPAVKGQALDDWVSLGSLENYTVGVPKLSTFTRTKVNGWERTTNSYGVYVLRKADGSTIVFSNVCTHLSCRVTWKEETKTYDCPCHDARFNINGEVVYGPPPRPLDQYHEIDVDEEDNLLIHLTEG